MPKKILIIDDEPDLMKIAVTRISKAGYTVLQAGDGKAGLAMVESEKPDLVLLDLAMPVMDGYEVCLRIKGSEASQHIPVVLFTASFATKSIEEKARELGVQDWITKPFQGGELLEKLRKILGE